MLLLSLWAVPPYVVAFPADRNKLMIAEFALCVKNPFARVENWMDANFNPGAGKAKVGGAKAVNMFLLLPKNDDAVVRAFNAMSSKRVTFVVGQTHAVIMTPHKDQAMMTLSRKEKSPLDLGDATLRLD